MLPFDILRLVFIEYAKQETLNYPLETLLLVCKAWAEFCLEMPLLWSVFNIILSTGPEAERWTSLVPKRLAKSGPTAPLYITIVNERKKSHKVSNEEGGRLGHYVCPISTASLDPSSEEHCPCSTEISDGISSILEALSGPNGDLCNRWTGLHLNLHLSVHQTGFFRSLVYPTPNLQELTIQGISILGRIFPGTPRLRDLSLMHSTIIDSQSTHGLLQVEPALERLEIQQYTSTSASTEPQTLPHLKSLVIRGTWKRLHSPYLSISVPNLTSFTSEMDIRTTNTPGDCFIIPFEKLHTLGIFFLGLRRNSFPKRYSSFTVGLIKMLSQASNVERIAGDHFSIWTLLLVLSISPRLANLHLTASRLTVCVMERRQCSRIESGLEGDEGVHVIGMGETMMADIEQIKELRGWGRGHPRDWSES